MSATKPDPDPTNTLDLPEWMLPTQELQKERAKLRREVTHATYEAMFEHVVDSVASGQPLTAVLERDQRGIDYRSFYSWILRDDRRKQRYYEAQELAAELVSAQMLKIADADDSLEDVGRSTLRINTRKWLLGVWNRKRFGDIKQIEQNVNIDLSGAMKEAQARLANRTIDAPARVIQFPAHQIAQEDD